MLQGLTPSAKFTINNNQYNEHTYYLADGIYPNWATFVKTISNPQSPKQAHYSKMQEAARKDVERAFGVLQARFQILDKPCRLWCSEAMAVIFRACVIMHNMIVEDERDNYRFNNCYLMEGPGYVPIELSPARVLPCTHDMIRSSMRCMYNEQQHIDLRNDLIDHLWTIHGDDNNEYNNL